MTGSATKLVIGNKNGSSWSLRPWLVMRHFKIPFEEINVDIYRPGAHERILEHSPSGLVPALKSGGLVIWDTLAIIEFLAERHPELAIWPRDAGKRALARSVAAEMHSGFADLRREMPMDFLGDERPAAISDGVAHDIRRIVAIWQFCRRHTPGGPYLFGAFSAADAMYVPVASRFRTYGVDLASHGDDGTAAAYCKKLLSMPVIDDWAAGARQQTAERGASS